MKHYIEYRINAISRFVYMTCNVTTIRYYKIFNDNIAVKYDIARSLILCYTLSLTRYDTHCIHRFVIAPI